MDVCVVDIKWRMVRMEGSIKGVSQELVWGVILFIVLININNIVNNINGKSIKVFEEEIRIWRSRDKLCKMIYLKKLKTNC